MSGVIVVGSINVDLIARVTERPGPGHTVIGESMVIHAGGKGANQALAAARMGAEVALVGAVGDDVFADAATAMLRKHGVDLHRLHVVPGATGIAMATVTPDGENTIVVIPGANATMDGGAVGAHAADIAAAQVVLLQGEIPRSGIEAAARAARGRLVVNLAPVIDVDPAVLRRADPLVVNEHEARGALAILTGGDVDAHADHDTAARALVAAGVPSVVVTIGSAGALVATPAADGAEVVRVRAPRVTVVDTIGAGDAFVGALTAGLHAGDSLSAAAQRAARVGAYAVTGVGAQGSYPDADTELPVV